MKKNVCMGLKIVIKLKPKQATLKLKLLAGIHFKHQHNKNASVT